MKARNILTLFFIILIIGTIYSLPQNIVVKQKTINCGEEITKNTILTQDLICGDNGLIIDANNIVLDCNNHFISAISLQGHFVSGNGITIENKQGITIRNCKINGYQHGIYLDNSHYNVIYNNIFDNNINAYETEDSFSNEWDLNSWQTGNGWFDLEENPNYPNYYSIAGPGNGRDNYPIPINPSQVVTTPIASQESGNVVYLSFVSLSTTTPQATIKYTLDGTAPNYDSQNYSSPITISQNTNLKARAYKLGYYSSSIATYNYTTSMPVIVCEDTIDSNTILTQDINCGEEQWVALNVSSDNITIDCNGRTINGSPGIDDWGINIIGRNGITIKNCRFTNLNFPIYHEDGSFNIIIDNNFWYTRHGPVLRKGNHNLISGNIVTGAEMDGIGVVGYLNDGIPSTDNNVINNTLLNCGSDYASMEISYGSNNIIRDNFIHATGQYDSSGIMLSAFSSNNLVEHNDINNGDYGIWVAWGSSNNLIKDNRIANSLYNGLYLDSEVYNNIVTQNDFLNNFSNAYQEADATNVWNQNGIGNYWFNHNCVDINEPIGICDNPYYIPGGVDNFPLANPFWGNYVNRSAPKIDIKAKPIREKEKQLEKSKDLPLQVFLE